MENWRIEMGARTIDVVKIVQGDVFFVTSRLPRGAVKRPRTQRGAVVAEGKATGHAHAVVEDGAEVWEADGQLYLQVDGETVALRHEEHKPVYIPKGTWRVGIVQEYDPFEREVHRVAD